jgi:hypothetical protein
MKTVRAAWGALPAAGLQPKHVQSLMDELAASPARRTTRWRSCRRSTSSGRARGHFEHSIVEGVTRYRTGGGHKPWTIEQQAAADQADGRDAQGLLPRPLHRAARIRCDPDLARRSSTMAASASCRRRTAPRSGRSGARSRIRCAPRWRRWERAPGPYVRQADGRSYEKAAIREAFRCRPG